MASSLAREESAVGTECPMRELRPIAIPNRALPCRATPAIDVTGETNSLPVMQTPRHVKGVGKLVRVSLTKSYFLGSD